ncbi:MAG: hypothetical protein H0W09_07150, partial [Solirubrobacterales bacterium]|nr:hypothetical protein [Solirubrobacterales bacterium]
GQQGAKLGRLPKLGPPVAGFEAELPGLFQPLLVAARGRLAVFALGERSARQAFSPGETIADAGIFSPFSDQLGDEFQPSSVLNVEALERLLGGALIGPRLGVGRSYLEPLARIATGTRVDDERLVSRLILAFDGFNQ